MSLLNSTQTDVPTCLSNPRCAANSASTRLLVVCRRATLLLARQQFLSLPKKQGLETIDDATSTGFEPSRTSPKTITALCWQSSLGGQTPYLASDLISRHVGMPAVDVPSGPVSLNLGSSGQK